MRQPYIMLHLQQLMYALMRAQFQNAADTLAAGSGADTRVMVEHALNDEIYPNLYPSSDSVANVAIFNSEIARISASVTCSLKCRWTGSPSFTVKR